MIQKNIITESEEKNPNPLGFKLITGGKGPEDDNWLSKIEAGQRFLCRQTGDKGINLMEFRLLSSLDVVALVAPIQKGLAEDGIWFDTLRFSRTMEKVFAFPIIPEVLE